MIKIPIDFKNIDLKDTKTQRVLLILAVSSLAFIVYIYFIFVPQVARVINLAKKMGKIKIELKSAISTIAQTGSLNEKLEDYRKKLSYTKRSCR